MGGDHEDGDDAEHDADAAGADGGLGGAGGQVEDVVGLEDGVGVLALHDALDIKVEEGALAIDGTEDAEVAELAVEEWAAAQGGGLEQGDGGVLLDGDGAGGFELPEEVDDADAGGDDGVARVD